MKFRFRALFSIALIAICSLSAQAYDASYDSALEQMPSLKQAYTEMDNLSQYVEEFLRAAETSLDQSTNGVRGDFASHGKYASSYMASIRNQIYQAKVQLSQAAKFAVENPGLSGMTDVPEDLTCQGVTP